MPGDGDFNCPRDSNCKTLDPSTPWPLGRLAPPGVRPFSLCHPRFSRTYKRTFPKLSGPVRAYTSLVSPCAFSRKTAKNPNRPNTRPPRELQASAKAFFAYCHLRFCWTCAHPSPTRRFTPGSRAGGTSRESTAPDSAPRPACSRARLGSGASAAQNLCPIPRKTARKANRPNTRPPRKLHPPQTQ